MPQLLDEDNSQLGNGKEQVREQDQEYAIPNGNSLNSPVNSIASQLPEKTATSAKGRWGWTGFADKTLWDWLQFAAAIALPAILGLLTLQQEQIAEKNRRDEQQTAIKNRQQELNIATSNQRYSIMSDYFDAMTQLQLDGDLLGTLPTQAAARSPESEKAQQIARARTLNTLRQLDEDGPRKGQLLKFLYEAKLIGNQCQTDPRTLQATNCQEPILDLGGARLESITLEPPIPLQGIDLNEALLAGAKLQGIDLTAAEMEGAFLEGADLTGALLTEANLAGAKLNGTTLIKAYLRRANLSNANLTNANLQEADLRDAVLTGATLQGVDLKEAQYNNATKFPDGFNTDGRGMRLVD